MPPLRLAIWALFSVSVLFGLRTVEGQYVVIPETAGPTAGGNTITVSGTWNPAVETPVVKLQGMLVAAQSLWMTSTSLSIKVPPGPGCSGSEDFLEVKKDPGGSLQLSITFSYDPPTITAIVPMPAQFGDGLGSITLYGTNFGASSSCNKPTVQVSAISLWGTPFFAMM
jgi:hypothetical protein